VHLSAQLSSSLIQCQRQRVRRKLPYQFYYLFQKQFLCCIVIFDFNNGTKENSNAECSFYQLIQTNILTKKESIIVAF